MLQQFPSSYSPYTAVQEYAEKWQEESFEPAKRNSPSGLWFIYDPDPWSR